MNVNVIESEMVLYANCYRLDYSLTEPENSKHCLAIACNNNNNNTQQAEVGRERGHFMAFRAGKLCFYFIVRNKLEKRETQIVIMSNTQLLAGTVTVTIQNLP